MTNFNGVIIGESLENKDVLQKVKILSTKVEEVTEEHKTPWIKQWTLHTVEILENQADEITKDLSRSLDSEHSWYADFKNDKFHYIIFRNKIFKVDRSKPEQYSNVIKYGLTLGIPDYQLDFSPPETPQLNNQISKYNKTTSLSGFSRENPHQKPNSSSSQSHIT